MTLQVNFDTIKSEIVTYKERRTTMYEIIKGFFHAIEPGLDDAFEWLDIFFG